MNIVCHFVQKCKWKLTLLLKSFLSLLKNEKLQTISDSAQTACFSICFKSSNLLPVVPSIQLQVTDTSITLPLVKASEYGLLGLDFDTLLLTQGNFRGQSVHRAMLLPFNDEYIDTNVTSLTFITYFDASSSSLYPGHLEQLSIACPNLRRLDLSNNSECLNNLQGLHNLANNCKSLQGLNLTEIHTNNSGFDCLQFWEILCKLRLTQLAIEACMIRIHNHQLALGYSSVAIRWQKIVNMFQNYASLRVLEVGVKAPFINCLSNYCNNPTDDELLLISYFPLVTSYRLCSLPFSSYCHTLMRILSFKHLRCLYLYKRSPGMILLSLEDYCPSLQQLYIDSQDTVPTEAFIDALSSHGRLEHVILHVKSLSAENINSVIEHSTNLVTFHVTMYSRLTGIFKNELKKLFAAIRSKFSKRGLFNVGGNFGISVKYPAYTDYIVGVIDDKLLFNTNLLEFSYSHS